MLFHSLRLSAICLSSYMLGLKPPIPFFLCLEKKSDRSQAALLFFGLNHPFQILRRSCFVYIRNRKNRIFSIPNKLTRFGKRGVPSSFITPPLPSHPPTTSAILEFEPRLLSYRRHSPICDPDWPIGTSLPAAQQSGTLPSFDLCGWP